jgi:hypothetical protein
LTFKLKINKIKGRITIIANLTKKKKRNYLHDTKFQAISLLPSIIFKENLYCLLYIIIPTLIVKGTLILYYLKFFFARLQLKVNITYKDKINQKLVSFELNYFILILEFYFIKKFSTYYIIIIFYPWTFISHLYTTILTVHMWESCHIYILVCLDIIR